jgi:hypothetical protein
VRSPEKKQGPGLTLIRWSRTQPRRNRQPSRPPSRLSLPEPQSHSLYPPPPPVTPGCAQVLHEGGKGGASPRRPPTPPPLCKDTARSPGDQDAGPETGPAHPARCPSPAAVTRLPRCSSGNPVAPDPARWHPSPMPPGHPPLVPSPARVRSPSPGHARLPRSLSVPGARHGPRATLPHGQPPPLTARLEDGISTERAAGAPYPPLSLLPGWRKEDARHPRALLLRSYSLPLSPFPPPRISLLSIPKT